MKKTTVIGLIVAIIAIVCIAGIAVLCTNRENDEAVNAVEDYSESEPSSAINIETETEINSEEESTSESLTETDTYQEPLIEEEEGEVGEGINIIEELDIYLYTQTACNLREGDTTGYSIVAVLEKGVLVHVTGRTDKGWYRVDFGGEEGYVRCDMLGIDLPIDPSQPSSGSGSTSETPKTTPETTPESKPSSDSRTDTKTPSDNTPADNTPAGGNDEQALRDALKRIYDSAEYTHNPATDGKAW